jgi:anti-sigma factor RsiW
MQIMKCKEALARLVALVDGELSPAVSERVREHLSECPGCTAAAEETRRIQQLSAVWVTAEADVWDAVHTQISTPDMVSVVARLHALEREVSALRAEVAMLHSATLPTEPAPARLNSQGWPAAAQGPTNPMGRDYPITMVARTNTSGRSQPRLRIV